MVYLLFGVWDFVLYQFLFSFCLVEKNCFGGLKQKECWTITEITEVGNRFMSLENNRECVTLDAK